MSHLARFCLQVIISSAFESSIGLAQYACLSHAVNELHLRPSQPSTSSVTRPQAKTSPVSTHCLPASAAHGLATESWFKRSPETGLVRLHGAERLAVSLEAAHSVLVMACSLYTDQSENVSVYSHMLGDGQLRLPAIVFQPASIPSHLSRHCVVKTSCGQYNFYIHEMHPADGSFHTVTTDSQLSSGDRSAHAASSANDGQQQQPFGSPKSGVEKPVCVFLHGFLGSGDDWLPIMQSLAMTHQCFSLDLPGHGRSKVDSQGMSMQEAAVTVTVTTALDAYACFAHFRLFATCQSGVRMHADNYLHLFRSYKLLQCKYCCSCTGCHAAMRMVETKLTTRCHCQDKLCKIVLCFT